MISLAKLGSDPQRALQVAEIRPCTFTKWERRNSTLPAACCSREQSHTIDDCAHTELMQVQICMGVCTAITKKYRLGTLALPVLLQEILLWLAQLTTVHVCGLGVAWEFEPSPHAEPFSHELQVPCVVFAEQ